MNLVVAREPDKICWSDACPFGLGGYSLSGRAWRLCIPKTSPIFGHKGINNLLEFLGMAVNIWLACLESTGGEHCILAIGDNTSAIRWLHNSSRLDIRWDAQRAHLKVVRKIASLLINFQCCLASQHLKGNSTSSRTYSCSREMTPEEKTTRSRPTGPQTTNSPGGS